MHRSALVHGLCLVLLGLSGCIVVPVGELLRGPSLEEQVLIAGDGFFSRDKIALIDLDGVITGDDSSGILGSQENTVAELKARLLRAEGDPEMQGVVLRVSSPGGEVTACDVIHHEILEFKKRTRMPVVAVIGDMGASGGYYVACAADFVFAQPTSVVGSIGVILQTVNVAGLMEKIGVETLAIKSAEKKDLLSPFRARTEEEKAILKRVVDSMYQRFVDVVAARTGGPPRDEVLKVADGRILPGADARDAKLVDRLGYLPEALEMVRDRAEIRRRPTVVRYSRKSRSGANVYSLAGPPAQGAGEGAVDIHLRSDLFPRARFLYLWQP